MNLPGDCHHDGFVLADDYLLWRKNDGNPAGYNAWRAIFANAPGAGAGANGVTSASPAVPEPNTRVLIASVLALLTARWR